MFKLRRGDDGHRSVRVRYRSQSLHEIRDLSVMQAADTQGVPVPLCHNGDACRAAEFHALAVSPAPR